MADPALERLSVTISDGDSITVVADIALSETHALSNTVTDHPIEEGSDATDHSRPNPDLLTLECVISNTPLSREQQQRIEQSGSAIAGQNPKNQPGYAEQQYDLLKQLRDTGALLTVVTSLKTYGDQPDNKVTIESLSVPRTAKNANALQFTISFKLVRVVRNKFTRVKVAKDTRAQQKIKKGAKDTKSPPEKPELDPLRKLHKGASDGLNAMVDHVEAIF